MNKYVLGIDEAGRGPVIGFMIIAGVVVSSETEKLFLELGVRDSKSLTRSAREKLFLAIVEASERVFVKIIHPREIDKYVINRLELEKIISIIKDSCIALSKCPDEIYIDAVGDVERNTLYIRRRLGLENIYMEIDAETKHLSVAAASIVAKVLRDLHIDLLKSILGDFGSGYPSDPQTIRWLEENKDLVEKYKNIFIREKWETVKRILGSKDIISLDKFFKR